MKSVIRWQERIIEVLILLKLTEQCRSLSRNRLLIIVGWLLSILAPASLPVLADSDDEPLTEVLQILYTNDIESVYAPLPALWRDDMAYIGGLPKLGTLIEQKRAQEKQTLVFDAGDLFTGALSKATQGRLAFDLYGVMGYDAVALGNHEFEYGWETLRHVRQRASFPLLNANIFYEDSSIPFGQAYTLFRRGNVTVAVLGLMGVDAFHNTMMASHRRGLTIEDPITAARRWVPKLREEADIVVLLTHQGRTAPMQTDKASDPEVQRGIDEEYRLAGEVPGIDLLIAGHTDHGLLSPVRHERTGTIIVQTFGQGMHVGVLKVRWSAGQPLQVLSAELTPVNADVLPDATSVSTLIEEARQAHPDLTEIVGRLEGNAPRRYYRESVLGNWVADVIRETAQADIGMITPGALRADLIAGDVTVEAIKNVFPFLDTIAVVTLSGAELISVIEQGLWRAYGLPQYSGLTLTYDLSQPFGERLQSLLVAGEPVKRGRRYSLATGSFTAGGGEGYTQFEQAEVQPIAGLLADALVASVRAKESIMPPDLGRQIAIED